MSPSGLAMLLHLAGLLAICSSAGSPSARTMGDMQSVYDWPTQNCAQRHEKDTNRVPLALNART
jgi:hypothetical protein